MLLLKTVLAISTVLGVQSLTLPNNEGASAVEASSLDGEEAVSAAAAVSEEVAQAEVCQADSAFFIPYEATSKESAVAVCNQYGGDLAPVSNANFGDVTALLYNCQGANSHAWIKSWDDTDYGSDCLTLYTGSSIPGGGIDINCVGDAIAPICIKKRGAANGGARAKPVVDAPKYSPVAPTSTSQTYTIIGGAIGVVTPTTTPSSTAPFTGIEPIPNDTVLFVSSQIEVFDDGHSVVAPN